MPVLDRAAAKGFALFRSTTPAFSGVHGQIDHIGMGVTTHSGQGVDEAGALRVAACWIAVTVIADEVASLTQKIVRKDDVRRQPVEPPELRALWSDEPNPDQSRFGLDATEVLSEALWGASYTMLGWTRAGVLDVRWPLDPNRLTLERMDDMGLRLYAPDQGELRNHPGQRAEFAYVPLFTLPGEVQPVSPVRKAAELLGLSLAYEETAARLMGKGLQPSAVLTAGEAVDEPTAAALSARLTRLHGGSGHAGGVAVLGGKDLKLERLTMSMADAEFVAQNDRVFQVAMALWRVPPTVAGMVDKPSTWGTGVAEFSRGLERFTLRPYVMRRQAAHEKFITQWVDPSLQVRYRFDSLLSAAPRERTEIQRLRVTNGLTSVERVLAQEDEPPFGADETVMTQLAYATPRDRELESLRRRAATAAELVRAGVDQERALAAVGIDVDALIGGGA